MRITVGLFVAVHLATASAHAQVLLEVIVPRETSEESALYVAGTFNGWNPGHSDFQLSRTAARKYALTLPASIRGRIEFKFTLGSWQRVEVDSSGGDKPNRLYIVPDSGRGTYSGIVEGWRDGEHQPETTSTASASVSILDEAFEMPQLDRTRRIWVYLPPEYAEVSERYPVLYMHDGQNVFDRSTSFAGEWEVDETLDARYRSGRPTPIVVAIDNGGTLRLDEYSPWSNAEYGGGQGDSYVRFIVETLKPQIDTRFRTLPDRLHTGIGGSSMGGLISLYAALRHADVFGRAAIFSPAFWFAPEIFEFVRSSPPPLPGTRLYFVSGALEAGPDSSASYEDDQDRMIDVLSGIGYRVGAEVKSAVRADGAHAEWFWRREFLDAYEWIFPDGE